MEPANMMAANRQNIWRRFVNWFIDEDIEEDEANKGKYKKEWSEEMRGMSSLVSTVISTLTFPGTINPPGGVFQANNGSIVKELIACAKNESLGSAGIAALPLIYPGEYQRFQIYNTFCFVSSLCVTLFLVSGVPLNNRFSIWVLSVGMIFTLTSLALTYLFGLRLISPAEEDSWNQTLKIVKYSINTWFSIVGMVTVILTLRFLAWFVNKCIKNRNQNGDQTNR